MVRVDKKPRQVNYEEALESNIYLAKNVELGELSN